MDIGENVGRKVVVCMYSHLYCWRCCSTVLLLLFTWTSCVMSCSGIVQKHWPADNTAAVYESCSAWECGCSYSCSYQPERNAI